MSFFLRRDINLWIITSHAKLTTPIPIKSIEIKFLNHVESRPWSSSGIDEGQIIPVAMKIIATINPRISVLYFSKRRE